MRQRLLSRMLLALLVMATGRITLAAGNVTAIEDLQYGNLLFQSYNDNEFNTITRLMAVQQRDALKHREQDVQMLLGRLELAYDLPADAERQFRKALATAVDRDVRNRAWYSLGRIAYDDGDYEQTGKLLLNFVPASDRELAAEQALLLARAKMKRGQYQEAAARLTDIDVRGDMATYLRLNRGVALLQLGWVEAGREALEVIGLMQTDDPERRALRDRANLNLGYEMLRARRPDTALTFLNRVRLNGPYSQSALLGAGWAHIVAEDYVNALEPWLELSKRRPDDAAVQEAYLALPFAYEKLNDKSRAIQSYKTAITLYDQELDRLAGVARSVETGFVDSIVDQLVADPSRARLRDELRLDAVPGAPYLVAALADTEFQQQLQHYRELMFLQRQLDQCSDTIDRLRSTKAAHRHGGSTTTSIAARFRALRDKLTARSADNDPLGLATARERRQWQRLAALRARIEASGNTPELQALADKTRWLQGILYWQIQDEYPQRQRNLRVLVQQLQGPITDVLQRRHTVEQALDTTKAGYLSAEDRLDALQIRLELLRPEIGPALQQTGKALQAIALKTISRRRERIASYRAQAQYALARIDDELAQRQRDEVRR